MSIVKSARTLFSSRKTKNTFNSYPSLNQESNTCSVVKKGAPLKQKKTCGFCCGNHVIKNCSNIKTYGDPWEGRVLVKYIEYQSPYGILPRDLANKVITEDITKVKNAKHIVIHLVYAICTPNPNSAFTPESAVLCMTFLDKMATPLPSYHRCYVKGDSAIAYLHRHMPTNARKMFCTVEKESVGSDFSLRSNPRL